jgi:hypothetical protein
MGYFANRPGVKRSTSSSSSSGGGKGRDITGKGRGFKRTTSGSQPRQITSKGGTTKRVTRTPEQTKQLAKQLETIDPKLSLAYKQIASRQATTTKETFNILDEYAKNTRQSVGGQYQTLKPITQNGKVVGYRDLERRQSVQLTRSQAARIEAERIRQKEIPIIKKIIQQNTAVSIGGDLATFKEVKDKKGNIVGYRDVITRQTLRLKPRERASQEGIRDSKIRRLIDKADLRRVGSTRLSYDQLFKKAKKIDPRTIKKEQINILKRFVSKPTNLVKSIFRGAKTYSLLSNKIIRGGPTLAKSINKTLQWTKNLQQLVNSIKKGSDNKTRDFLLRKILKQKNANNIINTINGLSNVKKAQKIKITREEANVLNKQVAKDFPAAKKLLLAQIGKSGDSDLNNFTILLNIILGGAAVSSIGPRSAAIVQKLGTAFGLYQTGAVGLETIKNPSPENFGNLVFFAFPTALAVTKVLRKLSPSFKPTVKNLKEIKGQIRAKLERNSRVLSQAKKRKLLKEQKLIQEQNKILRQALKEIRFIDKNPAYIKSRDYNPIVYTKLLKKLQKSYKDLYHVTPTKRINKVFGQTVEKLISEKKFKELIKQLDKSKVKATDIKPIGFPLTKKRQVSTEILKWIRLKKLPLTGSFAQNLFIKGRFRRTPGDIDIKAISPLKSVKSIQRFLKKKFPKESITIKKLKKAYRIEVNGNGILDIAKLPKGLKTINFKGYKIVARSEQLLSKFKGAKDLTRRGKDIPDIVRLSEGKIKRSKVLPKTKNPSNVFETVEIPGGMGKSRLKFDENHFYMDFEAAIGYSQGKPYSIIKYPRARISKFPKKLQLGINKASKGLLNQKQMNSLRRSLNKHIKANPKKFFIGPRTASGPIGEREVVLAVFSKLFKGNKYKTFDNDLQKFIQVVELQFTKPKKISLFKRFKESYGKYPFMSLKLRLTNPDIAKIRRLRKILDKDITLSPKNQNKFIQLFNKVIKFKKPFDNKKGNKYTSKIKKLNEEFDKTLKKAKTELQLEKAYGKSILKSRKLLREIKKDFGKNNNFYKNTRKKLKALESSNKRRLNVVKRKLKPIIRKPKTRVRKKPKKRVTKRPITRSRAKKRVTKRPITRTKPRPRVKKRTIKRPITRPRIRRRPKTRSRVRPKIRPRAKTRVVKRVTPRPRPRIPVKPITRKQIIKDLDRVDKKTKKVLKQLKQKKKFIYIPDLESIIYGVKATKKQKVRYLDPKKIFTGLERRGLI